LRRQAAERGGHEYHPAVAVHGDVVNVEVARGVADLRDVQPVASLVDFAGPQRVLEAPQLVQGIHPQSLAVGPQPHAAAEGALEDRQLAGRVPAQQE